MQDLKPAEIWTESPGMVKLAESAEKTFNALAYLEGETDQPLKQRLSLLLSKARTTEVPSA